MFGALKHSGRRAFLRGLGGTALALPLLEYTHGDAWAADGDATLRFLTVFSHGGTITDQSHSSLHDGTGKLQKVQSDAGILLAWSATWSSASVAAYCSGSGALS